MAIGMSSRLVHEKAVNNPTFFVSLASTAHGKFIPQTGAVLIKDAEGNVLGACGSSGVHADQVEAACIYGVEKAGFKIG